MVVVRTQYFLRPAARVIIARGSGTNEKIFLCLAARGSRTLCSVTGPRVSCTNAKLYEVQPRVLFLRVVVVRTQNFLSQAVRVSGARGRGTNAKFS